MRLCLAPPRSHYHSIRVRTQVSNRVQCVQFCVSVHGVPRGVCVFGVRNRDLLICSLTASMEFEISYAASDDGPLILVIGTDGVAVRAFSGRGVLRCILCVVRVDVCALTRFRLRIPVRTISCS